ncbi:hypothetical protein AYL99_00678 [Fonsecaea erecta]|uniref:Zn(2)-C6 fungal-type domain-containing protein n=1 Tax=Fonsecaea erecta TaxID=1367422 RepID=A0A178ZZ95_9EURO|nr:hypothetical protein AYL99_00678 [Fonsecaea erecta]OAP64706.1 hypothetical protein AYL99_00678 [Fonsecaea erecta]
MASLGCFDSSPNSAAPADEAETKRTRKRRSHPKSRLGCTACRRRRVKCDEARPRCSNCQRREEACSLQDLIPTSRRKILQPQEPCSGPGLQQGLRSQINMLQMKLLHHFNTLTAETLVFDVSIWRGRVMTLALQHEFLMHAVLLVASKHLCFLRPGDGSYRSASILHLTETLRLFRIALTQPISASNADAFIATSTLLVHYAWATDEGAVQGQNSKLSLNVDPLFCLSQGLRTLFMKAHYFIDTGESVFATPARYRPRKTLERATMGRSKPSQDLEILISEAYCRHRATSGRPVVVGTESVGLNSVTQFFFHLQTDNDDKALTGEEIAEEEANEDVELIGFLDATSRLVLILGFFQWQQSAITDPDLITDTALGQDPTSNASGIDRVGRRQIPPLSDLARFIFAFPTRSTDTFIRLVQHHHPHALLILCLFYRAVSLLLPRQQCWWSQRRAEVFGSAIECALRARRDAHLDTILEEGKSVLKGGAARISQGRGNTEVNVQGPLGVDTWDETWQRTRRVLERFGWRKGRWYSEQLATSPRNM